MNEDRKTNEDRKADGEEGRDLPDLPGPSGASASARISVGEPRAEVLGGAPR